MQVWAGLGNPGPQYAMHRHNVGFMALDAIAEVHGFAPVQKKFSGWVQEGRIGSHKALLLKPDRVAVFGYAHVPHMLPRQRRIDGSDLPDQPLRFAMADETSDLHGLQTRWAEIKYNTAAAEKEKAFLALIGDAEKLSAAHQSAPFLIWEGIIRSTYASVKGGLGALDQVKQAKKLFEQSIALQPDALNGAAYTSLGSLYYQVPGWPVGFGDDKKANEMLTRKYRAPFIVPDKV